MTRSDLTQGGDTGGAREGRRRGAARARGELMVTVVVRRIMTVGESMVRFECS